MNSTRIEVLAAEGDGDNVFGGGQVWMHGPDAGAEEAPDQVGCGRLTEAMSDDATWMWRWQAAIFRRTGLGHACDLWWLAVRACEKILGTRLWGGCGDCFHQASPECPRIFSHEQAQAGLDPGGGGEPLVVQRVEGHLTAALLRGLLASTDDRMERAVPRGWRGQK